MTALGKKASSLGTVWPLGSPCHRLEGRGEGFPGSTLSVPQGTAVPARPLPVSTPPPKSRPLGGASGSRPALGRVAWVGTDGGAAAGDTNISLCGAPRPGHSLVVTATMAVSGAGKAPWPHCPGAGHPCSAGLLPSCAVVVGSPSLPDPGHRSSTLFPRPWELFGRRGYSGDSWGGPGRGSGGVV